MLFKKYFAVATFCSFPLFASANVIEFSDIGGISNPDVIENFVNPNISANDVVTDQYAGVMFEGVGNTSSPRFDPCDGRWGKLPEYFGNNQYIASFGPGCTSSPNNQPIPSNFRVVFDQMVEAASFQFVTYHDEPLSAAVTISAFLGNNLVDTFDIFETTDNGTASQTSALNRARGWMNISGANFDSILVTENVSSNYLAMDNLAWRAAPIVSNENVVSEPTMVAVMGIGLLLLGAGRRKR